KSNVSGGWLPSLTFALGGSRTGRFLMQKQLSILPFVALSGLILFCSVGCVGLGSGTLPPRLTGAERARLKNVHLPVTVGVARNAQAPLVISRLRKTKLFDAVDYPDRLPQPPGVMAQLDYTPYGTAT